MQVRWSDCDPAGVVYYPNYFTLFESVLFAFMEQRGSTWPALMRDLALRFPRLDARCRYVGPATVAFFIEHAADRRPVAEGSVTFR